MEYRNTMIMNEVKREVFAEFCEEINKDKELRGNIIIKYDGSQNWGKLKIYETYGSDTIFRKALDLFWKIYKRF